MKTVEMIGQIIGFIGTVLIIISFQFKKPRTLILVQCSAQICFTIHYMMIGSYAGGVQNALAVLRAGCIMSGNKKLRSNAAKWVFMLLFLFSPMLFMFEGGFEPIKLLDFLPGIGMFINTYYIWNEPGVGLRRSQLYVVSPLWITYNAINRSYPGILTEVFNALSSLIFLLRIRRDKKTAAKGQPPENGKEQE